MSALASSAVTVVESYRFGGSSGKRTLMRKLRLALTGQGGVTNTIPASVLGFVTIEGCTNLHDSNTFKTYPASPSEDGLVLYLSDPEDATDATRADPADLTIDPAFIDVWGTA